MKVSCLVKVVKTKQNLTDVFRIVDVFVGLSNVLCVEDTIDDGLEDALIECLPRFGPVAFSSRLRWTTYPCGRQTRPGFGSSIEVRQIVAFFAMRTTP